MAFPWGAVASLAGSLLTGGSGPTVVPGGFSNNTGRQSSFHQLGGGYDVKSIEDIFGMMDDDEEKKKKFQGMGMASGMASNENDFYKGLFG